MSQLEIARVIIEFAGFLLALLGLPAALAAIQDILPAFRAGGRRDFRVRSTTIKALIADKSTEIIKMRTLRVFKPLRNIDGLDLIPKSFQDVSSDDNLAPFKDLYSIPGTAWATDDGTFSVRLDSIEPTLARGKDHTLVVGYVLDGDIQKLWEPTKLLAEPPVGSDRLILEVHFPPQKKLKHLPNGALAAHVSSVQQDRETRLEDERVQVKRYKQPPRDGAPEVEWIRAIVKEPPEKGNVAVVLNWEWEDRPIASLQVK